MKKYFQAPWTYKDLLISFLLAAILIPVTLIILDLTGISDIIEKSEQKGVYLVLIFILQWIIILVPMLVLTHKKYKIKAKYFGIKKIGILKTIGLIFTAYILYLSISLLITTFILYTGLKIPGYQIQEEIVPMFGTDTFSLVVAGILIVGLAPIIEEIFFRGFLLRTLANKSGVFLGSIVSAAIFAVFHMQWQSIIPIFILGLIINSIVIKSRSIIPAIGFHIFNNALAFTFEILLIKEVISLENVI